MPPTGALCSRHIPMLIIGGLFFTFGFVTWLNGSLIPFLQIACELNQFQAYLVTMAFYIAYTVTALPMAVILRRTGFKNGMALGLVVMAAGALLFIPAAQSRVYGIFLLALFLLGTGLTILQTAANPYVVLVGPHESAAARISMMGLLNKLAGVLAPLVFSAWVLTDMGQFSEERLAALGAGQREQALMELSSRLVTPYLVMAGMLGVLALAVRWSPLEEIAPGPEKDSDGPEERLVGHPQLILGVVALFLYVGVEVIAGDTIGVFGREQGVEHFGQLTSYTMAFMVLGYLLGLALIPRVISQQSALLASAMVGIALTFLLVSADAASTALWGALLAWTGLPGLPDPVLLLALFGLANALVWPAIWPLALDGLSVRMTALGSALLIMGISGGALLPLLYGGMADSSLGPQRAYWLMLPCYLFILFYAVRGHKMRHWLADKRGA